jgi:transcriptional regulator with XRE-family HTH domain
VRYRLRKQLGDFLRKARGEETYAQFARRVGLSASTLQRLEVGQQNVTIDSIESLVERLKCRISDVFAE